MDASLNMAWSMTLPYVECGMGKKEKKEKAAQPSTLAGGASCWTILYLRGVSFA